MHLIYKKLKNTFLISFWPKYVEKKSKSFKLRPLKLWFVFTNVQHQPLSPHSEKRNIHYQHSLILIMANIQHINAKHINLFHCKRILFIYSELVIMVNKFKELTDYNDMQKTNPSLIA